MGFPFTGENGLIDKVYLKGYRERTGESADNWLKGLLTLSVPKQAFLAAYRDLPPIETMPEKEKKEMELYIAELLPEGTDEEKQIACKVLYTIGTLL